MKKYNSLLFGVSALLLAALSAFNLSVDPLQFYRVNEKWAFDENQRFQNPALARTQDYDTIVLGNSYADNFLPAAIERRFGGKALKLSISGGMIHEQYLMAQAAFAAKKIRRVFWVVDSNAFMLTDSTLVRAGAFPHYLYRPAWIASLPYLTSWSTTERSLDALFPRARAKIALADLNTYWGNSTFGAKPVLDDWNMVGKALNGDRALRLKLLRHAATWQDRKQALFRKMLSFADRYPETRFEFVFPPHTVLHFVGDFRVNPENFFIRLMLKEEIRRFAEHRQNVGFWDFEGLYALEQDFWHYKDTSHYDLETVLAMLDAIANGHDWRPPQLHVPYLVKDWLAEKCAADAGPEDYWCPAVVRCNRFALTRWLDDGGITAQALSYADHSCL